MIIMPGGDGTGPWGTGGCGVPGGRALGLRGGMGYGRGYGRGMGYGRGFGYGRGYYWNYPNVVPNYGVPPAVYPATPQVNVEYLEAEQKNLEMALENIKKQIQDMKNSQ